MLTLHLFAVVQPTSAAMLFVLIFLIFITDINCLDGSLLSKYFTWDYKSDPQCQLQKEVFRNSLENKSEWAIRSEFKLKSMDIVIRLHFL